MSEDDLEEPVDAPRDPPCVHCDGTLSRSSPDERWRCRSCGAVYLDSDVGRYNGP